MITEIIGVEAVYEIMRIAVQEMCESFRTRFPGVKLQVLYVDNSLDMDFPSPPCFLISEIVTTTRLGFISVKKRIDLFTVNTELSEGRSGNKKVKCNVYDERIMDIARVEMVKCSEAVYAADVEITRDYV